MTDLPFFVVITKPNKHKIQEKIIANTGKDLEDVKNKIIHIFQEELSTAKSLPEEYDEFISKVWYKNHSSDAEPLQYRVFSENTWVTPWPTDDFYEWSCEVLHKLELMGAYINDANQDSEKFEDEEEASN